LGCYSELAGAIGRAIRLFRVSSLLRSHLDCLLISVQGSLEV
jgi:hypothetical protein